MGKELEMDLRAAQARNQRAKDEEAKSRYSQFSEFDSMLSHLAEVLSRPENRPILWRLAEESPKNGKHPDLTQFTVLGTQTKLELYAQDHRFYRLVHFIGRCDGKEQLRLYLDIYCSGSWGICETDGGKNTYILANSDHFMSSPAGLLPASKFGSMVKLTEDSLLNLAGILGVDFETFIPYIP